MYRARRFICAQLYSARGRRQRAAITFLFCALLSSPADAHNRPTALTGLTVDPIDPATLIATGTWGLAISEDRGGSWKWLCAAIYDVDPRYEDPPLALTEAGDFLAATYRGLRRSDGKLPCDWAPATVPLDQDFVIDVTTHGSEAWAISTQRAFDDTLHKSEDQGRSFRASFSVHDVLLDRVRVAPSDPRLVYLSGSRPLFPEVPRATFVLASENGGETFTRSEIALEEGETIGLLMGVSPADPSQIYVEVTNFNGQMAPERILRSDNGGRDFRVVLSAPDARSIAFSADGGKVWIGSTLSGLYRSDDGGDTFRNIAPNLHVRCLTYDRGELFVCTDPLLDGFALGRSTDDGDTINSYLRLSDVAEMVPCSRCSAGGAVCPAWTPDVVYDLAIDASLPDGFDPDLGTGAPRDAGEIPHDCPVVTDAGVAPVPDDPDCSCDQTRGHASVLFLGAALLYAIRRSIAARS